MTAITNSTAPTTDLFWWVGQKVSIHAWGTTLEQTWGICTQRAGKLFKHCSRLYRSRFDRENSSTHLISFEYIGRKDLIENPGRDLHNTPYIAFYSSQICVATSFQTSECLPKRWLIFTKFCQPLPVCCQIPSEIFLNSTRLNRL